MLSKELINYNNKLYWIYRKIRENAIKEGGVNDVKIFWGCDLVVRNKSNEENILYFLKEIPEAEVMI